MKNRKQFFTLLTVALIIVLASAIPAFAAGKKVKLAKKSLTVYAGEQCKVPLSYPNTAKKLKKVKYKSSNKKVATVSKTGLIKFKKKGNVKILVKYKGKQVNLKVRVKKCTNPNFQVTSFNNISLFVGDTFNQQAFGFKQISSKKVEYSVDVEGIISVSENGKITALKQGSTTLFVHSVVRPKLCYGVTVTVLNRPTPEESIWKEAYQNCIDDFVDDGKFKCRLIYLDSDNIPECAVWYNGEWAGLFCILSYKNGNVQQFQACDGPYFVKMAYTPKTGIFYVDRILGLRSAEWWDVMELNDSFEKIGSAWTDYEDYGLINFYQVNDEDVSGMEEIEAYLNSFGCTECLTSDNAYGSIDEAYEFLNETYNKNRKARKAFYDVMVNGMVPEGDYDEAVLKFLREETVGTFSELGSTFLLNDIDGDGVEELFFLEWQENLRSINDFEECGVAKTDLALKYKETGVEVIFCIGQGERGSLLMNNCQVMEISRISTYNDIWMPEESIWKDNTDEIYLSGQSYVCKEWDIFLEHQADDFERGYSIIKYEDTETNTDIGTEYFIDGYLVSKEEWQDGIQTNIINNLITGGSNSPMLAS